jgi:hypothetical protein
VLEIAREWNLIEANSLERIPYFNDPSRKTKQVAIFTPEEFKEVLGALYSR